MKLKSYFLRGSLRAVLSASLVSGVLSIAHATMPPPGFVLKETLTVPAGLSGGQDREGGDRSKATISTINGVTVVTSDTVLTAGKTYKLRASGTAPVRGSGGRCNFIDAQFFNFELDGSPCGGGVGSVEGRTQFGLDINPTAFGGARSVNWGVYTPTHEYTVDFVGTGAKVSAALNDTVYTDNSGSLTLEIFAQADAPIASQSVPTLSQWSLLALILGIGGFAARRERRM